MPNGEPQPVQPSAPEPVEDEPFPDEDPFPGEDPLFEDEPPREPSGRNAMLSWIALACGAVGIVFAMVWNSWLWESVTWGVAAPIVLALGLAGVVLGILGRRPDPVPHGVEWAAWAGVGLGGLAALLGVLFFVVGISGDPLF